MSDWRKDVKTEEFATGEAYRPGWDALAELNVRYKAALISAMNSLGDIKRTAHKDMADKIAGDEIEKILRVFSA